VAAGPGKFWFVTAVRIRRAACWVAIGVPLASIMSACITLTALPRAVVTADGRIDVRSLPCASVAEDLAALPLSAPRLDPAAIRVVTWNIHKEDDAGWQLDLARFTADSDIVLLQEATLGASLLEILDHAQMRFVMASSFLYAETDVGVLTAARMAPRASCTERVVEPWLRVPKSAVVSWFALWGTRQTLAVANIHAINFSTIDAYRAQLAALVAALSKHDGPIVFAGDFNTWTEAREEGFRAAAAALGLREIAYADDRRALFFGRPLDHILVRGLAVVDAMAIPVKSSDHNPIWATLRLDPAPR
jgi:endonuclease/exonuclease/phosphatase (EEP) superfamily protein YafD